MNLIGGTKEIGGTMKTETTAESEETAERDAGPAVERMRDKMNQLRGRSRMLSSCCRKKNWQ